ncbi:VOC family protein [Sphingobium sp. TKS]|uniref:VOC family protein n=1 Tax=Sphingobium sp. TKS TaxID=1315974 RepID=UPI00076FFFF0|nr:VOC family protein [Sphingobium sp. TKS]AMK21090.1 metapyrocatechase [Sphingobium sp. TKS]
MDSSLATAGIHSLDRFELEVPDLGEARRFYETFGLNVCAEGDALTLRTFGDAHVWGRIRQGSAKRLLAIRLGIYQKDLDRLVAQIDSARIPAPANAGGDLWCAAPDGLPIELAVASKTSPDAKATFDIGARASRERGASARGARTQVRPRRLAHIALFTPDVPAAIDFYCNRLGMRLSDRSGDAVAFLHGRHGSEHHMLAFLRSDGRGLHHSSWDVGTLADVGLGAMQMGQAGYTAGWGLGRHVLGSNYFHYVRDPWGGFAEYSADMDYIAADAQWQAEDHPPEDSAFLWGPSPPTDIATNFEIEQSCGGSL